MVVEVARERVKIRAKLWVPEVDAPPLLLAASRSTPVRQPPRPAAVVTILPAALVTAAPAAVFTTLPAASLTAAPAAVVTTLPAASVTTVTAVTTVHRCGGDPGRLSRSGSSHRRRCGGNRCRGSSRHQQRCDVLQSNPHGAPSIGSRGRGWLADLTDVNAECARILPYSFSGRRAPNKSPVMSPLRGAIETHKSLPRAASFGTEQSHRRLEPDTAPTLSLRFRHGNSDPRPHLADLDEATDRRHFRQALPGQTADKNWREKGHRQPITRSRG